MRGGVGWRGSGECEDENNTCSGQLGMVCRGCGTVVGQSRNAGFVELVVGSNVWRERRPDDG